VQHTARVRYVHARTGRGYTDVVLDTPEPTPPVPSSALVALNVAVMLVAALCLSPILAGLWDGDPLYLMIGLYVTIPAGVALAWADYATFRRSAAAATRLGYVGVVLALVSAVVLLSGAILLVVLGESRLLPWWLLAGPPVILFAGACARMNLRWGEELASHDWLTRERDLQANRELDFENGDAPARPWRFTLLELLVFTILLGVAIGGARHLVQGLEPLIVEHASRDASPIRLPDDATDICFEKHPRGKLLLEFSTTEKSFLAWIEKDPPFRSDLVRPVQAIARRYDIERYLRAAPRAPHEVATLKRGWQYVSLGRAHDRTLAYDADARRVYYRALGR
jgi:hypothetical protein